MKVPLNWLKDYVDVILPPDELADMLTMAGCEAEKVETIGSSWDNVIIGQIKSVDPHPNADRLRLATVDLGTEQETVVCGAPNLNNGDKIVFARAGAKLINPYNGETEELKPAKIRGVESKGMICSEKELGISDSHEGILVLSPDAIVGTPLADYMGDTVFDLSITPNRPDCLSVIGIAREVAALTRQVVHIPESVYGELGAPIEEQVTIEIADPQLCPRYSASLITDVKIKDSPAWLQERLIACDQRPINNIVDITNYIMLEYGQPLHSFDFDNIDSKKIIIRRADDGEKFFTLDGNERELNSKMLVIGDGERTVAIAGVMGGLNSEVTDNTTSILLEAASFNAASIHYTSNYLNLLSEASMRFGRGISAEMTIPALKHATQLIAELGEGKVAKGIIDIYPGKKDSATVTVTPQEMKRLIGIDYSREQIVRSLTSLGFECKVEGSQVHAITPYWRSDIMLPADLVEEVARIIGYEKIPATLLSDPLPQINQEPIVNLKRRIRQSLVGFGFQEIYTYSLVNLKGLSNLSPDPSLPEPIPIRVANPMSAEQEYLRPTLRANVLETLIDNRRHEEDGIRFFELGKTYQAKKDDLPDEPEILCGLISGPRVEKSWLGVDGNFDFYDVKGIVEALLENLGIKHTFEKSNDIGLHPARQATIMTEFDGKKTVLGVIGELHPKVADNFETEETVCLFEIDVAALLPFTSVYSLYQPIPRFPSSTRDLALVVDKDVTHQQITDIIAKFSLVSEVKLFDVYSGKQLPEGKKSLAYRLKYQSPDKTLTDEMVNEVQEQILKKLIKELGATLRG
jgi:phenylalanyl-tRNA synthetase beta chain